MITPVVKVALLVESIVEKRLSLRIDSYYLGFRLEPNKL